MFSENILTCASYTVPLPLASHQFLSLLCIYKFAFLVILCFCSSNDFGILRRADVFKKTETTIIAINVETRVVLVEFNREKPILISVFRGHGQPKTNLKMIKIK
jgi:hypothetical protein